MGAASGPGAPLDPERESAGPADPTRTAGSDAAGPAAAHDATRTAQPSTPSGAGDEPCGERIGDYRIVGRLGAGGMGEVLDAVQEGALRRRVALKLIRPGMDSRQVIGRFESERLALALMSHNHIARVFDAGTTPGGRPYFAMEFVDGRPITAYCDARRLTIRERLALFLDVCDGVRHAHQKGIIHRDLKPSNVLVAEEDGLAVPKIIDFGIAKATAQPLTADVVATQHGHFVGTPAYMSPEQADLTGADIDTRTDVYSLGVMLYELLVGARPLDDTRNQAASFDELWRRIREDEPERPSTFVSSRAATAGDLAQRRRTDPRSLSGQLRGDLDWIVTRALEKNRDRRYQSVGELAADLERHLRHEPVLAGPPAASYRLGKFMRRHRLGVAAAALILLAVVAGAAAAAVGFVRATRAERIATREAALSGQVTEFLVGLFEVPDPREGRGAEITAREILDLGASRLQTALAGQDEVRATMLTTIGRVYDNLGMHDDAVPLLEEALATRAALLGDDHPACAETLKSLGHALVSRGDYRGAEERYRRALDVRRASLGDEHPLVAESLTDLAGLKLQLGDLAAAEDLATRSLAIIETLSGASPLATARNYQVIGNVRLASGDGEAAERAFSRALADYRAVRGEQHLEVGQMYLNLATTLALQGKAAEAEPLVNRGHAMLRKILGDEHPIVARSTMALAFVLHGEGKLEAAEAEARNALELHRRLLGEAHPQVAEAKMNLARVLNDRGRYDEALPLIEAAVELYHMILPPGHWVRAHTESILGGSLAGVGRFAEAEPVLLSSYEALRAGLGDAAFTREARGRIVRLYEAWQRPGDAAAYLRAEPGR